MLLNHQTFNGTLTRVYDDTDQGDVPGAEPTDGPGSLRDFVGEDAQGAWILTVSDNALFHTGLVDNLTLRLEPVTTNNAPPGDFSITRTAQPGRFITVPVNVPLGATNMTICISSMDPPDNLQLYVRQGDFPTATDFDQVQLFPLREAVCRWGWADATAFAGTLFHWRVQSRFRGSDISAVCDFPIRPVAHRPVHLREHQPAYGAD